MAQLPSMLQDINAFFKNESYAGRCNSVTMPKVVVKTVSQTLAGVGGEIERSTGKLEKLESTVSISDYAEKVIDLVGDNASRDEVFSIRGALEVNGEIKTIVVKMQGFWKDLEIGEWKPESDTPNKFMVCVEMFQLEIDGKEVIYINKLTNKFRVNGKDRNEKLRQALAQ